MEAVKWALIGLSVPVIGWLIVRTKRNARALNEKIDDYKREQEELQRQAGSRPINPYEQIAQLFAPKEDRK